MLIQMITGYLNIKRLARIGTATFLIALLSAACSSNKYNRTYRKVWKEVVNSPEWEASLASKQLAQNAAQNSGYGKVGKASADLPMDKAFIERYHHLVSRAYFKIIAQAENSDKQIRQTYEQLRADSGPPEQLALAERRYRAHKTMLDGLKSWNAFSENATADIEFFKAEHIIKAHEMLQRGIGEQEVIRYLMLEMADLYHVEEMRFLEE